MILIDDIILNPQKTVTQNINPDIARFSIKIESPEEMDELKDNG